MKKLLALLNAPMRRVIALGAVILGVEFLIMLLIEIGSTYLTSIPQVVWMLLDRIVFAMIAVLVLYIMIWHPMSKQLVELAFQNEEKEKRATELVIANKRNYVAAAQWPHKQYVNEMQGLRWPSLVNSVSHLFLITTK